MKSGYVINYSPKKEKRKRTLLTPAVIYIFVKQKNKTWIFLKFIYGYI